MYRQTIGDARILRLQRHESSMGFTKTKRSGTVDGRGEYRGVEDILNKAIYTKSIAVPLDPKETGIKIKKLKN